MKALCDFLNEYNFYESMLENPDRDQELTHQIQNHVSNTGSSIQQIAFASVTMSLYLVEKLFPSRQGSLTFFDKFWIEPCELAEQMIDSVNDAINRALYNMIDETN